MENELIKTKIENLIKETKQLKIDDVISYIKIKFPENEFSWENIDERSDFYYDRRDIIHLTNQTRSEERRVGKECLRLCRSRWSPYH